MRIKKILGVLSTFQKLFFIYKHKFGVTMSSSGAENTTPIKEPVDFYEYKTKQVEDLHKKLNNLNEQMTELKGNYLKHLCFFYDSIQNFRHNYFQSLYL